MPDENKPAESCFDLFLDEETKRQSMVDANPVSSKGEGKKGRPSMEFVDPSLKAPDRLKFLGWLCM